jgi:hypothetical protein
MSRKRSKSGELVGRLRRPRAGARIPDGALTGTSSKMETIRPENTDPIPLRASPHRMGTIMIRFVGLLIAAIVVLALIWSR